MANLCVQLLNGNCVGRQNYTPASVILVLIKEHHSTRTKHDSGTFGSCTRVLKSLRVPAHQKKNEMFLSCSEGFAGSGGCTLWPRREDDQFHCRWVHPVSDTQPKQKGPNRGATKCCIGESCVSDRVDRFVGMWNHLAHLQQTLNESKRNGDSFHPEWCVRMRKISGL